ncbi:T9SS type A sorting domain-containing protein [Adhaeribacter sp. BT258]|uniref:T9SS type A sorting domain-containing protein n=1 Tax=Adhaeribacter terrigena TaxID=2793070 RepID=A0ABS1C5T3_9BACT|nr:T9SS type A sorting domain-containing protein [Adhaeribacter terrigena]MBK0404571.1 T9SS type A sorting domain-containing protein [Adhaeribacter terrigena]
MKKLYVLAGALFMATGAFAQGHELFFSAYNEGAHPNGSIPPGGTTASQGSERAMQIFNPTTSAVPVERYSIARYSNGGTTPFQEERLVKNQPSAVSNYQLPSSDVFVVGSFKATILDITNNWDQRSADYTASDPSVIKEGGPVTFDGNDAMVLRRWTGATAGQGTPIIVDIVGVIGDMPNPTATAPTGTAWFSNPPAYPVTVSTRNMSLSRKSNIETGVTSTTAATYQIGDEWEVYSAWNSGTTPADYFAQDYSNLASHTYTGRLGAYSPTGVLEDFDRAISIYPNPATNKNLNISIKNTKVSEITILNGVGQNIKVIPANAASAEIKVDVSSLKPGMYFVKFVGANEFKTTIYKTVVVQ